MRLDTPVRRIRGNLTQRAAVWEHYTGKRSTKMRHAVESNRANFFRPAFTRPLRLAPPPWFWKSHIEASDAPSWLKAESMLYRRLLSLLATCSFVLALLPSALCQDFTIIVLPDTENEAQFFPSVLDSQTSWIVNNQKALNIQMVLGVGDIVNDGADPAQQANADAAVRLLDNAGVPYMLAIGNHDYDGANPKSSRSVIGFNQTFGPARYAGYSFYKG